MKKFFMLQLLIMSMVTAWSQSIHYKDVAVVINSNSNPSIHIGEYFAEQRDIPDENLIYVDASADELIDTLEFMDILQQIRQHFTNHQLVDSINYIVTTMDIPHNVRTGDSCTGITGAIECSSFDSELTLMFSEWEDQMLKNTWVPNPYYETALNFSREAFGVYLVTRLDAYNESQAVSMIDHGGPGQLIEKENTNIVFDISHCDSTVAQLFSSYYQNAMDFLIDNNWPVIFHEDTTMLTYASNVLGYASVNYDHNKQMPGFSYLPGSFSFQLAPTGETSFNENLNPWYLTLPDLIKDGASGGSGYANIIYFSQSPNLEDFYGRYLQDTAEISYNLAESYYSSIMTLSKQYILLGDPKTSVKVVYAGIENPAADLSDLRISPNPAHQYVRVSLNCRNPKNITIHVYNMNGQQVMKNLYDLHEGNNQILLDIIRLPRGVYQFMIHSKDGQFISEKIVKL